MAESTRLIFCLILLGSALVSAGLTVIAWRRQHLTVSARPMALFGFAMTWWCLTYAIHWSDFYRPSEYFWLDLTYIGAVIVPASFLAFALCYVQLCHLLTRRVIALLCVVPLLTLLFLWTDGRFGYFFAGARPGEASVILAGGVGYWFNIVYSYLLIAIGFIILGRAYRRAPVVYRRQTGMILLGAAVPWAINLITVLGVSPYPALDFTPVAFVVTGIAFSYGVFRYGFLNLVPIARSALVESMPDGMLVLDKLNCLVDINPAAMRLLEIDGTAPIGKPVEVVTKHWEALLPRHMDAIEGSDEIMVDGPAPRFLDVNIHPLRDRRGKFSGRLISLRDITTRKESELELRRVGQRLQLQLAENEALQAKLKEQAIRDPLTGLFNRRYLTEALEREFSKAERQKTPISLVLMDIDRFKRCNDTFGHKAGDLVLIALANMLLNMTRREDIVCRYGGEEFLVVLPGMEGEDARLRTEEWRLTFQHLTIPQRGFRLKATLSAGIACYPNDGNTLDKLLRVADESLYKAKQAGRNQVAYEG
jgi:diguanylate cyclase (GGDEF)-like protein